jgi:hypothetical protein
VTEVGGFKVAPLQNTDKGREQEFVFSKKTETPSLITSLPVKEVVFTNSSLGGNGNFAPLEKPHSSSEKNKWNSNARENSRKWQ